MTRPLANLNLFSFEPSKDEPTLVLGVVVLLHNPVMLELQIITDDWTFSGKIMANLPGLEAKHPHTITLPT